MKNRSLTYLSLTATFSLLLSACGTFPQQSYGIYDTPMPSTEISFPTEERTIVIYDTPAIIMPTGNCGEVYTTKSSKTSGDSQTQTEGGCITNESQDFHTNGEINNIQEQNANEMFKAFGF